MAAESAPNGYSKVVSRLRTANEEKTRRTLQREKIPAGENYMKNKQMKPNPPRSFYEKKEKTLAALYIDVSIAPGKSGRIAVNKGDDPAVLAENFAKTFHLNRQMKDALIKLLTESIKVRFGEEGGDNENDMYHLFSEGALIILWLI